ncbi:2-phospho-L-lactate transferase [Motiliproteus sp. MSK22-1]|uniref:2-phospho-L-lactate transferase n=1 Tax=Motiliproteus sp. MSK22-1 TaxID=1897630 RepID=UPI000975FC5A|nr:2-phospho-L-lactate transferase [Motiliproteus sp. MSK22-1]OMH39397.1 2-phospho-L-lactate transferase [Motiliproteus sp. MSK22-1]
MSISLRGKAPKITLLAGGVGGAKMAEGLLHSRYGDNLTIIGNVADDQDFHGLWVSPDIDTLTYTLADQIDREKGWGLKDESNRTLDALNRLGVDTWMYLGDQDFATHIYRTEQRKLGVRPTDITSHIARQLGVETPILLPTDDVIQTRVRTTEGWMDFQSYFVKHRCEPLIKDFSIVGIKLAKPTPEALVAIADADLIVFAPSNPIVSIGAILAVPGIREAVTKSQAYKLAVSPLINGQTVKGPADKMMTAAGYSCDLFGIADCYEGLIDGLLVDQQDRSAVPGLAGRGLDVLATDTLMHSRANKIRVAETLMHLYESRQRQNETGQQEFEVHQRNSSQPLSQAV